MKLFNPFRVLFLSLLTVCIVPLKASKEATRGFGLNDVPWNANRFSLMWWDKEGSGKRLSISTISTNYRRRERKRVTEVNYDIYLNEIRYDFLHRSSTGRFKNVYLLRGFGIGAGFGISEATLYSDPADKKIKNFRAKLNFYLPMGVEHFFWNKFPNISYSLNADMSIKSEFTYNKYIIETDTSSTTDAIDKHGRLIFKLEPGFFFNIYF